MVAMKSVLVVDPSDETRDILCSVLQQRGLRTWGARRTTEARELVETHAPDCIVVDLDDRLPGQTPCEVAAQLGDRAVFVFLSATCRRAAQLPAPGELVAKPYQYAPLIRKIEVLLAATAAA